MGFCFEFSESLEPCSLERYLAAELGLDYLEVRRWIKAGHVSVDGQPAKASRHLRPGQRIEVEPPPPRPHAAGAEALPLPIRYLDADLVVVAKPAGMASHPGPGWWRGSCVNALLHAIPDWPGIGGVAGPGIVHRLDRDTSGLLIFARSGAAHQGLLTAMRERRIARKYLAWVTGSLTGSGTLDAPLARDPADSRRMAVQPQGKPALTHYRAMLTGPERSLLLLQLETGRQHQIRVHLADIGHPVWGDQVYGTVEGAQGSLMALHAGFLAFAHPISGERLSFTEPVPAAWAALGPLPNPESLKDS